MEQFKAILTYKTLGEVKWAHSDFDNWEQVREEAGQMLKEAHPNDHDIQIEAVSNHGHSLEISKEESVNNM